MGLRFSGFVFSTDGIALDAGNGASVGITKDGTIEFKAENGDVSFGIDSIGGSFNGNELKVTESDGETTLTVNIKDGPSGSVTGKLVDGKLQVDSYEVTEKVWMSHLCYLATILMGMAPDLINEIYTWNGAVMGDPIGNASLTRTY